MLDEYILEYGGFSAARGRCHVILDESIPAALVGDPVDNPGTSVKRATEQIGLELHRTLGFDAMRHQLYEYVPWEPRLRREWTASVEFRGDAWSMPVWDEVAQDSNFVTAALALVRSHDPYSLVTMRHLQLVNPLVRVRVDAFGGSEAVDRIYSLGTVEHISQRRFYYVDIAASDPDEALEAARQALSPQLAPEKVQLTTPNAPLDQPGTLPI